jgi:hypothetical protein
LTCRICYQRHFNILSGWQQQIWRASSMTRSTGPTDAHILQPHSFPS